MKNFKLQRNTWCITGILFLIVFTLDVKEGRTSYISCILLALAAAASFMSAYANHKRINTK